MTFGKPCNPSCLVFATWHCARQSYVFCPEDVTAEFHTACKAESECEKKAENSKAAVVKPHTQIPDSFNKWSTLGGSASWVSKQEHVKEKHIDAAEEAGDTGKSKGGISPLRKWGWYLVYVQRWGLMFPNTSPRFEEQLINNKGLITLYYWKSVLKFHPSYIHFTPL